MHSDDLRASYMLLFRREKGCKCLGDEELGISVSGSVFKSRHNGDLICKLLLKDESKG